MTTSSVDSAHELGLDCAWECNRIYDEIARLEPDTEKTEYLLPHLKRSFDVSAKIAGMLLYLDYKGDETSS